MGVLRPDRCEMPRACCPAGWDRRVGLTNRRGMLARGERLEDREKPGERLVFPTPGSPCCLSSLRGALSACPPLAAVALERLSCSGRPSVEQHALMVAVVVVKELSGCRPFIALSIQRSRRPNE